MANDPTAPGRDSQVAPPIPTTGVGLSARLLLLTVLFVMLAELLIFAPSIARYRRVYLEDRLKAAELAALALEAAPGNALDRRLTNEVLGRAGLDGVVLRKPGYKVLALASDMPEAIDVTVELHMLKDDYLPWIGQAFNTLAQGEDRVLRVLGRSPRDPGIMVEYLMHETPMRVAMYDYANRILALSVVISLATATLLYFSLQWMMVRPMRRLTRHMIRFRLSPGDEDAVLQPGRRSDEIGIAERELAAMQAEVLAALRQQDRLAALGGAVAKINHDLRNTLSTAMLVSDRLAASEDPDVREVTPRLFAAIDRAIVMCSQTLDFAREGALRLAVQSQRLADILEEAEASAAPPLPDDDDTAWIINVPEDLTMEVDRDQLIRVLVNLYRNARDAGAVIFKVSARPTDDGMVEIIAADDGPGLPEKARAHLFQPFLGSSRKGGTGLGLVIARDIVRAHHGTIELQKSDAGGTVFVIRLPRRADVSSSQET